MSKVLFCAADCHLERCLRNRPVFKEDSAKAFRSMCENIVGHKASEKALIIAGDVLDKNYATGAGLQVLAESFDYLWRNHIKVYTIMGNHDADTASIPEIEGAVNLDKNLIDILGWKVYGLDFRPSDILRKELESVPECDLLVLHQPFHHLLSFEGASDLTVEDIPPQVNNVLCGDVHTTDVFEMSENRYFVSPGSLHPVKLDENVDHGFMMYDGKKWEFSKIPTRTIYRKHILSDEDVEDLKKLDNEDLKGAVIEIKYLRSFESAVSSFQTKHPEAEFIVSGEAESVIGDETSPGRVSSSMTDRLKDVVSPDKKPEMYSFTYRLLTENPSKVVQERMAKFM